MLVIVFLVLSLGIGSLRNDQETTPVSALHPTLVIVNQTTQGYLGVEKLVVLNVGGRFFVDKPISTPRGLDEHSIADFENFSPGPPNQVDRVPFALERTLAPGSAFYASGARKETTGVASGILIDDEFLLVGCSQVLTAKTPFVSSGGQCRPVSDVVQVPRFWSDVNSVTQLWPEKPGRCYAKKCSAKIGSTDINFSGINSGPWNGAAVSFGEREAFKARMHFVGLTCGLEGSVQRQILVELGKNERENEHVIYYGTNSFRLFSGEAGFSYLKKRISANAETSLEVSVFDPNKKDSVTQTFIKFNSLARGKHLPDGVVFASQEACEETNSFLLIEGAEDDGYFPNSYPGQILRLFSFDVRAGKLENIYGVDEIESR